MVEHAFQRDRFRNRAPCCQAAKTHEHAQGHLRPPTHMQAIDDNDGYGGTSEIGECIKSETNVSGQIRDTRAEAFGLS